jgi:hypothetical protein
MNPNKDKYMAETKIQIKYNWQVNNNNLDGKFKGSAQCGPTSCCMMISAFVPDASTDAFVKSFIEIIDKDWLSGNVESRQSAFQFNYEKSINQVLKKYNINKKAVLKPHSATLEDIKHALAKGSPVMTSTRLTGDGHYICIVGWNDEEQCFIVHDPYGRFNFTTGKYAEVKDGAGAFVKYKYDDLAPAMVKSSQTVNKSGFRIIWIE